jgi:Protein of unknown function (DUF2911)
MKQTISLAIIMMLAISSVFAKDKTRVSPHETVKNANMNITYGRPSVKGRVIFGTTAENALEPSGEIWRTGADEATEITFNKDCVISGSHVVKAGTYTLFTQLSKSEWVVILNSKLGQWGAFGYDKVKDKNVMQTALPVKHLDNIVETFTITPKKDGFLMEWEHASVFVPIQFYGDKK